MFNGQPYKYNILNATFSFFTLYFSFGLLQCDHRDFRAGADAGREDGFSQSGVDIKMLRTLRVEPVAVSEHKTARAPA